MCCLTDLSPEQLSLLVSLTAILITSGLDAGDINVLGNFIASLGATMLTIAAQLQEQEDKSGKEKVKQNLISQIQILQEQIKQLE